MKLVLQYLYLTFPALSCRLRVGIGKNIGLNLLLNLSVHFMFGLFCIWFHNYDIFVFIYIFIYIYLFIYLFINR